MSVALSHTEDLERQGKNQVAGTGNTKKGTDDPIKTQAKNQVGQGNATPMVQSHDKGTSTAAAAQTQQGAGNSGTVAMTMEGDKLGAALQSYKRLVRLANNVQAGEEALKNASESDKPVLEERLRQAKALYERFGGDSGKQAAYATIAKLKGEDYAKAYEKLITSKVDTGWSWEKSGEKKSENWHQKKADYKNQIPVTKKPDEEKEEGQKEEDEKIAPVTKEGIETKNSLLGARGSGHEEMSHGRHADVYMDYSLLEASAKVEADASVDETGAQELQKLIESIRNAKSLWEVIGIVAKLDPKKLTQYGAEAKASVEAAITAFKGTITVDGAPIPFSLGSESMILEWLMSVNAGAYAKIWAEGKADASLQKLQLNASGSAGAKAVIDAGASLWTRATHMSGASPAPVAEGAVEGSVSAGASAEAHFDMKVGADVIEISAGAGVTWGLGASLSGKLRVSIINSIKLVAAVLGANGKTLPEPLAKIWNAVGSDGDRVRKLIDLKEWITQGNPLDFLVKFFTGEQIREVIVQLLMGQLRNASFVKWLQKYVKLGDEASGTVTIGDITFQSHIVYWAIKAGIEVLKFVDWGLDWAMEKFFQVGVTALQWLVKAGYIVAKHVFKAWESVKGFIKLLAEKYPKTAQFLEQAGEKAWKFLSILGGLAVDVVGKVLDLLQTVGSAIIDFIVAHEADIEAAIEFIKTASKKVWGWIKTGGAVVADAFMACGKWLVEVAEAIGNEIVSILEEAAPQLIKLGQAISPVVVQAIKKFGASLLRVLAKLGAEFVKTLEELGGGLNKFLLSLQKVAKAFGNIIWDDLTFLYQKYGKRALEFLQKIDALGGGALKKLYKFIKDNSPAWKKLVEGAFQDLMRLLGEAKDVLAKGVDGLIEVLKAARDFGNWVLKLGNNLLGPTIDVLKKYGPTYRKIFKEIGGLGLELAKFIAKVGKKVMDEIIAKVEQVGKVIKWIGTKLMPLAEKLGAGIVKAFEIVSAIGEKAVGYLVKYGQAFVDFAKKVGQALWPWLKKAGEVAVKAAMALGDYFVTIYDTLKEGFLELLEKSGDLISSLYKTMRREVIVPAIRLAVKLGTWVFHFVRKYGQAFVQWLEKAGQAVWDVLKAAAKPVIEVAYWVGDKIATLLSKAKAVFVKVASVAYSGLKAIYKKASKLVAPAIEAIAKAGSWVIGYVAKYGEKAIEVLMKASTKVLTWLKAAGKSAMAFVMKHGKAALDFISKHLGEPLKKLFQAAGSTLASLWKVYGAPALSKLVSAVKMFGAWVFDGLKRLGIKIYGFLTGVALGIAKKIKKLGKKAWDWLVKSGPKAWAMVKKYGAKFLEEVTTMLGKGLAWLVDKILGGGAALYEHLKSLAKNLYRGASALVTMIKSAGQTVFNNLKKVGMMTLSGLKRLSGYAKNLGNMFSRFLKGIGRTVSSWLSSNDEACKIVESGAYHLLDAKARGGIIHILLKGRVPDREERAILRLMRYAVKVGDLKQMLAAAEGSASKTANSILWALQGSNDTAARNIFQANGISW